LGVLELILGLVRFVISEWFLLTKILHHLKSHGKNQQYCLIGQNYFCLLTHGLICKKYLLLADITLACGAVFY
jgi:hypothetical protein